MSAQATEPEMFAELSPPYSTIVADPPWPYEGTGVNFDTGKKTGLPYSSMRVDDIARLPVMALAVKTLRTVTLPDGGFLVVDDIRCVRVRFKDYCYRVIVISTDGREVEVASWIGAVYSGFRFTDNRTDEEREVEAAKFAAVNLNAHNKAEAFAEELRWVVEQQPTGHAGAHGVPTDQAGQSRPTEQGA